MPDDEQAINPDDVRNFYRERAAQRERKDAIGAAMGEQKTNFADATGLNKTAIGFAERLDRLSPEVRGDVLRSLDKIRSAMDGVWGQQEEMQFSEPTADEQAENLKRKRTSAKREKKAKADAPLDDSFASTISPAAIDWREDIPGIDDTGEDAPFDVDQQDADFLAPDETEAA